MEKKLTPKKAAFEDMKKAGLSISLFIWEKGFLKVDGRKLRHQSDDKELLTETNVW